MNGSTRNGSNNRKLVLLIVLLSLVLTSVVSPVAMEVYAKPGGTQKANIEKAVIKAITKVKGAAPKHGVFVDVKRVSEDNLWAFGTIVLLTPKQERPKDEAEAHLHHEMPEGWLWLARSTDKGWEAAIDYTPVFDSWVKKVPQQVVSTKEKEIFGSAGPEETSSDDVTTASTSSSEEEVEAAGIPDSKLSLPWAPGQRWEFSSGPHGWGGWSRPWSALDFAKGEGDGRVLAARDGLVYRPCGDTTYVMVRHADGWQTDYYHLTNIPKFNPDTWIERGTYLGNIGTTIACGGSASGAHVHFNIRYKGSHMEWHGRQIGGWTIYEGARSYEGYAQRGGERVYPGQLMFNYGVPWSNIDAAYPFYDGGYGVIKGDRYWYRKSPTSSWYTNTLKSSYYQSPNAAEVGVPTSNIDTAYIFPDGGYGVIKGDRYWYRKTPSSPWYTNTLKSSYYQSPNAAEVGVPTSDVDAAYVFPDGAYGVIKGDRYWYRATTTSPWYTNTLKSSFYQSPNAAEVGVPTSNIDTAYIFPDGSYTVIKGNRYWHRVTPTSPWYTNTLQSAYYP